MEEHGRTYATRAQAQADLFEYIEIFYNRTRRHSSLGYLAPLPFLENWACAKEKQQKMAA